MSRWKFFTDEEVEGLFPDIVYKLDRARELFGAPIIITSGYRDPIKNEQAGGVKESSHESGKAVDIRCADIDMQKRLIWALCIAGFKRIGAYDKHVHADVDDSKPTPAFWSGTSH